VLCFAAGFASFHIFTAMPSVRATAVIQEVLQTGMKVFAMGRLFVSQFAEVRAYCRQEIAQALDLPEQGRHVRITASADGDGVELGADHLGGAGFSGSL